MSSLDAAPPVPIPSVAPADVPAVDRWAEAQRSELVRLAELLQSTNADATTAEREERTEATPRSRQVPAEFAALVDTMLAVACVKLESDLEHARAQAADVIAVAMGEATSLLIAAGAGASTTRRVTGQASGPDPRVLRRPRRAQDLWQELDDARPKGDRLPRLGALAEVTIDLDDVPWPTLGDADEVHALFWQGVGDDSVRERLHRLAPRRRVR
jgi:hypothetical protein